MNLQEVFSEAHNVIGLSLKGSDSPLGPDRVLHATVQVEDMPLTVYLEVESPHMSPVEMFRFANRQHGKPMDVEFWRSCRVLQWSFAAGVDQ